jgi:hypothetical protein
MKVGPDPFALIRSFRGQIDELGSTVHSALLGHLGSEY